MPARRTHQPARRIGLQPTLVLAAIPHAVLGSQHPTPALAVEHGKVAHRDAKGAWLEISHAPLLDEILEANLGFGEGIDCHAGEYGARD